MNKYFSILLFLLLPSAVFAEDPIRDQPNWVFELKGGRFMPGLEDWTRYYSRRYMIQYGASLAYIIVPQVELGFGASSTKANGDAAAALHGKSYSNVVTYQLYPINAFILFRGIWSEDQLLVPYIGGGMTRVYYRQKIRDQDTVAGYTDGYHARGGLQFSLDTVDPSASNRMYLDYGIRSTYFFIEAEYTRAVVTSVSIDLGGTSYLGGLRFEF